MKSVRNRMSKIIKWIGTVMDFIAAIVPVAVFADFTWDPDDEDPVKYGVYLLAGTVIIGILCTVICGLAMGILGLVMLFFGRPILATVHLISVAWKHILIAVSIIILFILLGCLRLGRLKKGGCDGRHD